MAPEAVDPRTAGRRRAAAVTSRADRVGSATGLFAWVILAYLAGAVLSWQTFGGGIGPAFFLPAGVTAAAMLLAPRSRWPVVVAAVLVAELAVDLRYGVELWAAAGFAVANAVEPLVSAIVVLAWCRGTPDLRRRDDLAKFVAGACVLGPLAGGVLGGAVTTIQDGAWWPSALLHWWVGDGIGVLVMAAPILLWPLQSYILAARKAETVLLLAGTAVVSVFAFWIEAPPALLLLPLMAWAAFRLDVIGAALSGTVMAMAANVMTHAGRGLLAQMDLPTPLRPAVTQGFIAVLVLVSMLIAQEAAGRVAAIRQRQVEQRERARLGALAKLGELLSGALTPTQIGEAAVGQVLNDAGAQALNIGLVSADGTRLEWVTMAGYPDQVLARFGGGLPLTESVAATDAVNLGRPVLIRDVDEYRRQYPHNVSWMTASGAVTSVSWPLTAGGQAIGVLVLVWRHRQPLDIAQLAYTSAVATMIAQALVRARIYADEHARAAVLQAAVLPSNPAISGLEVAVGYEPADVAQGLGGDWYDVLELPGGRTYLAVGDVVGHGLPAVQDMAQLRSAGRALAVQGLPPPRLLTELNIFARVASISRFATMNVAVHDPATGVLRYGSAGHPPAFLRRAATGEVVRLDAGRGPVLGPVVEAGYAQGEVTVAAGDILVMYTDGLVESRAHDIGAGMARLQRLLADWPGATALPEACRQLVRILAPPPRRDDVCVVAVRFGATAPPPT